LPSHIFDKNLSHIPSNAQLFVVIGDVHDKIRQALEFLLRLEDEIQEEIAQVFSVGDFGLFLAEEDWNWLTGPSKYRRPERSAEIRRAWEAWPWPLAMVGGNHEPWGRLRDWDPTYFGNKLTYTNAGLLCHRLEGLRVAGLSGIHSTGTNPARTPPEDPSWPEIVAQRRYGKVSPRAFTHYRKVDVDEVLKVESPHLVLLHDWPIDPPHSRNPGECRPERDIVELLRPTLVFSGHHHTPYETVLFDRTKFVALNILVSDRSKTAQRPNPGWAWIGRWNGQSIQEIGFWPNV
jgi:hypothetical protein